MVFALGLVCLAHCSNLLPLLTVKTRTAFCGQNAHSSLCESNRAILTKCSAHIGYVFPPKPSLPVLVHVRCVMVGQYDELLALHEHRTREVP